MRSSILSGEFLSITLSQVRVSYGTGRWFGRPPFSNLLRGGCFYYLLCACLPSWPLSWCLGLCGEISLITSFLSSHHIRLDRSSPDYFKFNSYRPCWISWSFWTRWVMACMFMTVLWSSRLTFGTSVWAYQVWQDLFFVLAQPPDRSWQEFFGNIRIYSSLPTLWLMS